MSRMYIIGCSSYQELQMEAAHSSHSDNNNVIAMCITVRHIHDSHLNGQTVYISLHAESFCTIVPM